MDTQNIFWTKAYSKNIGWMIAVCYRYVPNKQIAEDLAHDAFLTAMEKSSSYLGWGNFSAWLYRIAVNTALSYLRSRPVEVGLDELAEIPENSDKEQDDNVFYEVDCSSHEILEAVASLPEPYRVVFNLYVLEHYRHQKIAKMLDISVGTSKSRLSRARKQLKSVLRQKFQKHEEKRRTKRIFLLLLFPCCRQHYADAQCLKKLSGYVIPATHSHGVLNLPQSHISLPLKKSLWMLMVAMGVSLLIVTGYALFVNKNVVLPETPEIYETVLPVDSISSTPDSIIVGKTVKDSVLHPVVRKKVVRHRTVVVRDTVIVVP